MPVHRPTEEQMKEIAEDLGLSMSPEKLAEFMECMEGNWTAYDLIDSLPDEKPIVKYARTPGYRPMPEDNPHNAWAIKSEILGSGKGKLKGKTVVVKDNVCVAGVPMMNGSSTLEGYTPDIDATMVTRLLDEGATIMGKSHCEAFCFSSSSHTNSTGLVHNPHKKGYSAGGSSSGSAVLVSSGEVDMAIGGDQGGSIRMPASFSGCYGMKPTHGLVPYTGAMPIESTIDHAGPMTGTLEDNALMLEVLAGDDGLDPRQKDVKTANYSEAFGKGAKGLKIGVVEEGFGIEGGDADVDESVKAVSAALAEAGAEIVEVSIPMHLDGLLIWTPIALEGMQWQMMNGNGMGMNWKGLYNLGLMKAHSGWRDHSNDFSDSLKISMMVAEYAIRQWGGHYYGKAQNLVRRLTAAYDAALQECDVLLMPSTPMKARPFPEASATLADYLTHGFEPLTNTAPFDATGHPALSIPCAMREGLPVGAMFIGKHFDEMTVYQAADAYVSSVDWKSA
jgi:amidase